LVLSAATIRARFSSRCSTFHLSSSWGFVYLNRHLFMVSFCSEHFHTTVKSLSLVQSTKAAQSWDTGRVQSAEKESRDSALADLAKVNEICLALHLWFAHFHCVFLHLAEEHFLLTLCELDQHHGCCRKEKGKKERERKKEKRKKERK